MAAAGGCDRAAIPWLERRLLDPDRRAVVRRVLALLNQDREDYVRSSGGGGEAAAAFARTRRALAALHQTVRGLHPVLARILLPRRAIAVVPRAQPYAVHGRDVLVRTGSTDGYSIQFYPRLVMSDWFDQQSAHGGPRPRGVHHYVAVMLHEFGHVVHRALVRHQRERTVQLLLRTMLREGDLLRCWNARADSFDRQSEWFANAFVRTAFAVAG